jgi:hypothetical protein
MLRVADTWPSGVPVDPRSGQTCLRGAALSYRLSGPLGAVIGLKCRESLGGLTARFQPVVDQLAGGFHVLPEAGEPERWLAVAATASRDGFGGDLADADRSYRGSSVEVKLRLESGPSSGGAEPPLECLLTPLEPAWHKITDGGLGADRQYAVPAAAWVRPRSYSGLIICGQPVALDGSVPVVGRPCASNTDLVKDDPLGMAGPLRPRLVPRRLRPGGVPPHSSSRSRLSRLGPDPFFSAESPGSGCSASPGGRAPPGPPRRRSLFRVVAASGAGRGRIKRRRNDAHPNI